MDIAGGHVVGSCVSERSNLDRKKDELHPSPTIMDENQSVVDRFDNKSSSRRVDNDNGADRVA